NWGASSADGGSPGRPNSLLTDNIAAMIVDGTHFPAIPRSTDPVTISATIIDESTNVSVSLVYRVDSRQTNLFASIPMFDDGLHGDGAAGDGVFGAQVPPRPNLTVIEFYIQASD